MSTNKFQKCSFMGVKVSIFAVSKIFIIHIVVTFTTVSDTTPSARFCNTVSVTAIKSSYTHKFNSSISFLSITNPIKKNIPLKLPSFRAEIHPIRIRWPKDIQQSKNGAARTCTARKVSLT